MKRRKLSGGFARSRAIRWPEHGGAAPISQAKIAAKVHETAILSFVVSTMPS
jgi:hypothetical protein